METNVELVTCDHCGGEFEASEINEHGVCSDCYDDFIQCDKCGSEHHVDDMETAIDDHGEEVPICSDCYDRARTCFCCECTIRPGSHVYCQGETICINCEENDTFECGECGEREFNSNSCTVRDSDDCAMEVCNSCYENSNYCEDCGISYLCDDCPRCGGGNRDGIESYCHKPRPTFIGHDSTTYYGVELEIESVSDMAFEIPRRNEHANVYYKEDGSLSNGFEIVTEPHTLNAFYDSYDNTTGLFGAIYRLQEKARSHNTSTCGLHIHMTRPDRLIVAKMMSFVRTHIEMFERLCRRDSNQYAALDRMPSLDSKSRKFICGTDKYAALSDRGKTIEFRLPRGTLKASTVMATIELYDGLRKYCSITPAINLSAEGYYNYCHENYREVRNYDRFRDLDKSKYFVKRIAREYVRPKRSLETVDVSPSITAVCTDIASGIASGISTAYSEQTGVAIPQVFDAEYHDAARHLVLVSPASYIISNSTVSLCVNITNGLYGAFQLYSRVNAAIYALVSDSRIDGESLVDRINRVIDPSYIGTAMELFKHVIEGEVQCAL